MCALVRYCGTIFSEQVKLGKNENFTLFSSFCLLNLACPKFLKIIQETNFDMGSQKIDIRDRYKKSQFFLSVSQILSHLNGPKIFFLNFRLGTFFFKLQLLFNMKINKTKNFGVRAKKINFFTFGPKNPP